MLEYAFTEYQRALHDLQTATHPYTKQIRQARVEFWLKEVQRLS